ncbi:MAG: hypothetical protein IPO71_05820 [Nitrosomonas sp.]|nr:hypothetical protein [Nitrosomonas sp.]
MLTEVCCVVIAALCEKIESCWTASIAYSSNLKNRVDEVIEKAIVDHSDRMIRLAVKHRSSNALQVRHWVSISSVCSGTPSAGNSVTVRSYLSSAQDSHVNVAI